MAQPNRSSLQKGDSMTIILAASLIPPLFLLWKVYEHDKIEKNPSAFAHDFSVRHGLTLPAGLPSQPGCLF